MSVLTERATRRAGQWLRRWITLVSAGWLSHFITSSRGCLCLRSGIIARMPTQNFRGFPSSIPRIALPVRWQIYRYYGCLLYISGGAATSWDSRQWRDLSGDVPDEAAQL